MRRLLLPLTPFVAVGCDESFAPERPDAGADASAEIQSYFAIETPVAPVIAPLATRSTRSEAPAAVHTLASAPAKATTLERFLPSLGLVPGLAEDLANGKLAGPTEDLELPESVQALSNAPWLLLDGRIVLAQDDQLSDTWVTGPAKLTRTPAVEADGDNDGLFVAEKPLAFARLPANIKTLAGATVRVFDHTKEVCVGRISDLGIEAQLLHVADSYDENDKPEPVVHDAASVFEEGVAMLLAEIEPVSGTRADCARGTWAAPLDASSPTLYQSVAMDKKLSRMAVRAFRKTPEWKARQADFENFYPDEPNATGRWDANTDHTFQRWLSHDGLREILAVHADTWDGCGSNGQTMTVLFEVHRDGAKASLATLAARAWDNIPAGLVDLESDGTLELIGDHVIFRWVDDTKTEDGDVEGAEVEDGYQELERLTIPDLSWHGCGC